MLIKRDDLLAPGLGGNKVRKLEYLLADAREGGCDSLVTVGAKQSNHARLTAVAGTMHRFDVHLVLGGSDPESVEGNLLLDILAGAAVHHVTSDNWSDLEEERRRVTEKLRANGRTPYSIPMGGSTEVGALGYVRAYLELADQLDSIGVERATIVHASSTGGTQAGLTAGRMLRLRGGGMGPDIVGVDVAKTEGDLCADVSRLATDVLNVLGIDAGVTRDDVVLTEAAGGAYGETTDEGVAGIIAGLRGAGIVTDPVYSGKALGAIARLARDRVLNPGPIVFLHTGGHPALFTDRYTADVLERGGSR